MDPLGPADRRQLLEIARRSIEIAVRRTANIDSAPETMIPPRLGSSGAAFVTLHKGGGLRGCIGLMRFDVPLWLNVRDAARAAALDDPRFPAVSESELPAIELEISVLEPPVDLADPTQFVAGRHGILIERGMSRGLLLPQVATEMGWGQTEMLDAVCRKANLPPDAWRDGSSRLQVFESECFSESQAPPPGNLD